MFERFADDARAAVSEAAEIAVSTRSARIGREHLLISLAAAVEPTLRGAGITSGHLRDVLNEHGATADAADVDVLADIGIDVDGLREQVYDRFGPGAWQAGDPTRRRTSGWLSRFSALDGKRFSPGARKALELGLREALADRSKLITSTHLLRGLLRDPGPIATALVESVLPLDELRVRAVEPPAA